MKPGDIYLKGAGAVVILPESPREYSMAWDVLKKADENTTARELRATISELIKHYRLAEPLR